MRNPFPILSNFFGNKKDSIEISQQSSDELENAIILAMIYISKNMDSEGKFVYQNNLNPKKKYSGNTYGTLRHAGTLYSMYLCERLLGKTALHNKRLLGSEYLIKTYIRKVNKDMYGLLSEPLKDEGIIFATSGGAGLSLCALANLLPENKVPKHILEKLANFILFMQTPKGDFWPSYIINKKEKSNISAARFYPGEACLGLLYLYEFDKQPQWLEAAKRGLFRLAVKAEEKGSSNIKFDHWGMLATQKLFATPDNAMNSPQRDLMRKFVERNVKAIIAKQNLNTRDEKFGSFTINRSLCGNATNMEGLIAAYQCLDDKVLKQKLAYSLKAGVEFLAKRQVKTGIHEGGVPASPDWDKPEAKNIDKEIRIDYVQHAMSAWLAYKSLSD